MRIKSKLIIIMTSLVMATIFVSGGYGYWQKDLTIQGEITVVKPVTVINNNQLMGEPVPLELNNQSDSLIGDQGLRNNQNDVLEPTNILGNNGTEASEDESLNQQDIVSNEEVINEVEELNQIDKSTQPEQPSQPEELEQSEQGQTSDQSTPIEKTIGTQNLENIDNKSSEDRESTQTETSEPVTGDPLVNVGDDN